MPATVSGPIEAAADEVVAVPVVNVRRQLILEPPFLAGQIRERQRGVALTLVIGVVDGGDDETLGALPCKNNHAIVGPIAVPARMQGTSCHCPSRKAGWRSTVSRRS